MTDFVKRSGIEFGSAKERFTRGQGDPVGHRTVESLCAGVLDFWRIRHPHDDALGRLNGIVLVSFALRQPVMDDLRQFALFQIPGPVVSQDKPARGFRHLEVLHLGFYFNIIGDTVDFPKDDDLAVLTLPHMAAELIRLT